uniref:Uncharacterized protein n=1 Tax=Arundo donax TaxID=35708 RepID=A0A0A9B9H0_ARUDO
MAAPWRKLCKPLLRASIQELTRSSSLPISMPASGRPPLHPATMQWFYKWLPPPAASLFKDTDLQHLGGVPHPPHLVPGHEADAPTQGAPLGPTPRHQQDDEEAASIALSSTA